MPTFTHDEMNIINFYLKEVLHHTGFAYDHHEGEVISLIAKTTLVGLPRKAASVDECIAIEQELERKYNEDFAIKYHSKGFIDGAKAYKAGTFVANGITDPDDPACEEDDDE
jgi:hypothetical protein